MLDHTDHNFLNSKANSSAKFPLEGTGAGLAYRLQCPSLAFIVIGTVSEVQNRLQS
jgi:hypothetical protein